MHIIMGSGKPNCFGIMEIGTMEILEHWVPSFVSNQYWTSAMSARIIENSISVNEDRYKSHNIPF